MQTQALKEGENSSARFAWGPSSGGGTPWNTGGHAATNSAENRQSPPSPSPPSYSSLPPPPQYVFTAHPYGPRPTMGAGGGCGGGSQQPQPPGFPKPSIHQVVGDPPPPPPPPPIIDTCGGRAKRLYQLTRSLFASSMALLALGLATAVLWSRFNYASYINSYVIECPRPGNSVWVGVSGLVTALVGSHVFGKDMSPSKRRCWMIIFFALAVSTTAGSGSLVTTAGRCVANDARLANDLAHDEQKIRNNTEEIEFMYRARKSLTAIMILQSAVVLTAIINVITLIVAISQTFACWCSNATTTSPTTTAVTVIYIHPESVSHIRRLAATVPPNQPNQQQQMYFVATTNVAAPSAPGLVK